MFVNIFNTDKKYNIIYADPPWSYKNMGNIQNNVLKHYNTMTNEDLYNLGETIKNISDKNCMLFIWCTFPKLQEGLNTIKAWGFEYKTIGFNWIKKTKKGKNFFGVGWYTKSNSEICLIGVKGKPIKKSNKVSQIIESVIEEHSKKTRYCKRKNNRVCRRFA